MQDVTNGSISTRRRHRLAVAEARDRVGTDGGLPMPTVATGKVSRIEQEEFKLRYAQHRLAVPDYDNGWTRPSAEMARAAVDYLRTLPGWSESSYAALHENADTRAQIALVALDAAITAARYAVPFARAKRIRARALSIGRLVNALARGWSPRFRYEVATTEATAVSQMSKGAVRAIQRDFLLQGVDLEAVWKFATGGTVTKGARTFLAGTVVYNLRRQRDRRADGGYGDRITVSLKKRVRPLERIIETDKAYAKARVSDAWRLILADEKAAPARGHRHVTAGIEYDVVTVGQESETVIGLLEDVRLGFDVSAFLADYARAKRGIPALKRAVRYAYDKGRERLIAEGAVDFDGKPITKDSRGRIYYKVTKKLTKRFEALGLVARDQQKPSWLRALQNKRDAAVAFENEYLSVRQQITREKLVGVVPIKARFFKVSNRRYEALGVWPARAQGKLGEPQVTERWTRHGQVIETTSPRGHWFRTVAGEPLAGFDIASSQIQIMAVLLGLRELEAIAGYQEPEVFEGKYKISKPSFKRFVAKMIWDARVGLLANDGAGYGGKWEPGANDPKLQALGKAMLMRLPYGSPVDVVMRDQRDDPETYGDGWVDNVEAVQDFMQTIPGYQALTQFLAAMRGIGELASDDFTGLVLVDPFDGERYRWNPIMVAPDSIQVDGGLRITLYAPGRMVALVKGARPEFVAHAMEGGHYPVDVKALRRKTCPCLVHSLDGMFSSFVIKALAGRSVPVVAVHDCWLTAADQLDALKAAIDEASEAWLRGLGPIYTRVAELLEASGQADYLTVWRKAEADWLERVRRGDWPRFLYAPSTLATEGIVAEPSAEDLAEDEPDGPDA